MPGKNLAVGSENGATGLPLKELMKADGIIQRGRRQEKAGVPADIMATIFPNWWRRFGPSQRSTISFPIPAKPRLRETHCAAYSRPLS